MKEGSIVVTLIALAAAAALIDGQSRAFNQQGALTREEPYSFFGPAVAAPQAAATYGLCANTKPVDAIYVAVVTDATFAMVDQNGATVVFNAVPAGTTLQVSPCRISVIVSGSVIPLYK